MMTRIVLVLVLLLVRQLVSASIYGFYPVASSVLMAGRIITVRWVDDGTQPLVKDIESARIDLYAGELFVTTLAKSVDPNSLSADVWVSPSWRHNGSNYHMRFICTQPSIIVYTADFTIIGMATIPPLDGPTIDDRNLSAPTITFLSEFSPPKATVISSGSRSTSTTSLQPSTTAPSLNTLEDEGSRRPLRAQTGAAIANLRKRPTVDLERLKFRFVFIFWPTLIGFTMAL